MRALAIAASLVITTTAVWAETAQERLTEATSVFSEVMKTPDKGIPQDLLAKAECVIVIPNLKKAAFVVGGEYGKGFAECRNTNGAGWGAPAAVKLEGGSVGFQIGGSSTDLILLVMNRHGMDQLMRGQVYAGRGCGGCGRSGGAHRGGANGCAAGRRDSGLVAIEGSVCGYFAERRGPAAGRERECRIIRPLDDQQGDPGRDDERARQRALTGH